MSLNPARRHQGRDRDRQDIDGVFEPNLRSEFLQDGTEGVLGKFPGDKMDPFF